MLDYIIIYGFSWTITIIIIIMHSKLEHANYIFNSKQNKKWDAGMHVPHNS